jgi:hypothetical protein
MAGTDFRAVLTADCGIEYTRVTLVDVVGENEYRLVAQSELPTTAEPPLSDVTLAIQQGIAELERSTGRQLLEGGQLRIPQGRDGQGVDAFVATCSAGGGLPVLVLAVTADITAQSAKRAVEGTYAVPFRVVTMEEILKNPPLGGEAAAVEQAPWWKVVEALHPGGVLLVGGVDGGNVAPLRTLARSLAEALPPRATSIEQEVAGTSLPVIYAGNRRAQEIVRHDLVSRAALHVVDNVRPTMRHEQLLPARQEIARLYDEQVLQRVAGYEALAALAQSPVQLPYMGVQLATRFVAVHHRRQVLTMDLGSGATTVVWAEGEQCVRVVLGSFGLGYGVGRVLAQRGVERIRRWLPFPAADEETRDWVLNRALRPHTMPTTVRDFLLQQAVAREALVTAVEELQEQVPASYEMVVATGGGLARAPRLTQTVLMLLDALQPTGEHSSGLIDLYLDRYRLIPSVGALATLNPDAAACVLMKDALSLLGPCLVPLGRPRKGAPALRLELQFPNEIRQEVEVCWGGVAIVPFQWGEEAHLTVRPARGVRLGLGRSGESQSTKGGDMIRGGSVGLIVDARGRPLGLPAEDERRMALLREWMEQCGAYTADELAGVQPPPPPPPPLPPPPVEEGTAPVETAGESAEPATSA